MKVLVTGSAGHLGEALMRSLAETGEEAVGLDLRPSPFTSLVGSLLDADFVARSLVGVEAVIHTATLHKPHVATHARSDFVDVNVTGMLRLLEAAIHSGVRRLVFTSTTSVYGLALSAPPGEPAVWVDEDLAPRPRNIYGVTKLAAEDLCGLFQRDHRLPCVVLRTSRFFPEEDDDPEVRARYDDANVKLNELLYRRVDLEDVVTAHLLALERAPSIGFARYVISATTPFTRADTRELRGDAPRVLRRVVPEYEPEYARRGWQMFPGLDRVYANRRAREDLGWQPRHDFRSYLARLRAGRPLQSPLAAQVGSKGYHDREFEDGPYPVSHGE